MSNANVTFDLKLSLDSNHRCTTMIDTQVGETTQINATILERNKVKTDIPSSATIKMVAIIENSKHEKFKITLDNLAASNGVVTITDTNAKLSAIAGVGWGEIYIQNGTSLAITNKFRIKVAGTNADDVGNALEDVGMAYASVLEMIDKYNEGLFEGMTAEEKTTMSGIKNDVSGLKTVVGDSSSGIVKDVADNTDNISKFRKDLNEAILGVGSYFRYIHPAFERGTLNGDANKVNSDSAFRSKNWLKFDDVTFVKISKGYKCIIYKKSNEVMKFWETSDVSYERLCMITDLNSVYNIVFRHTDGSIVTTESELESNLKFIVADEWGFKSKTAIDEKVDLMFINGGLSTNDNKLSINEYRAKMYMTQNWYKFACGVLSFENPNRHTIILDELDDEMNLISHQFNNDTIVKFDVNPANHYWISIYNGQGLAVDDTTRIKCHFNNKIDEIVSEIKFNFGNGTFTDGMTDVSNTLTVRTPIIYTHPNKIYLVTFPNELYCVFNTQFSNSSTYKNCVGIYNSFSFTDYSSKIRFGFKKKDGTDMDISDPLLSNIHLYEIDRVNCRDYDIYLSSKDSKKMGDISLTDENCQSILQGLLNCFNSIKIYLYGGTYLLNELYVTSKSEQNAFLYTNEMSPFKHSITLDGDHASRGGYEDTVYFKIDYDINNLNEATENAGILVPRRSISLDTRNSSETIISMSKIIVLGCGYTKPITYVDFTQAKATHLENVEVRGDGSLTGLGVFQTMPNEKCVGIRAGHGSDNGIQQYIKHCMIYMCGKGVSICGEHFVIEDVLAHHCKYGFAFGDLLTRGNFEHPNMMVGCSIEGCYRLMLLSRYGATEESDSDYANNTLVCTGLSTETRWDIPLDELTEEQIAAGNTYTATLPIKEILKGNYRGRIEADYMLSKGLFENDGSGKRMSSTLYSAYGTKITNYTS